MSNVKAVEFTSPVGRIVWGSLYEPNTKDFDGNPLVVKKGPDAGKPTQRYEFGLAIPKTQAHFGNEPGWGQLLWATAHTAFPGNPALAEPLDKGAFSWKVTDGDSTVIPAKAKIKVRPCDREGYKGHWVLKYSSAFAPKIYDARDVSNPVILEGKDAIVPGYAVQVVGSVAGNTGNSPGIYINHLAVGLRAYMAEIRTSSVDVSGKFGGALPAGASTVPVGGFTAPSAPEPTAPAAAPGYVPPGAPAPALFPALFPPTPASAPAAAPVVVVPAPAIMGIPPATMAGAAPPPPPAAPAPMPTHKGHPVAAYLAAGWSMEQLRADGYTG